MKLCLRHRLKSAAVSVAHREEIVRTVQQAMRRIVVRGLCGHAFMAGLGFSINSCGVRPSVTGLARPSAKHSASFGSFRLFSSATATAGSRSSVFSAWLVERAGEHVSKDELTARIWPKIFAEDCGGTSR